VSTKYFTRLVVPAAVVLCVGSAYGASQYFGQPTLVNVVRDATERFRNPREALAAGYTALPTCVSGPEEGAMGVHFVDAVSIGDGALQADRPEALVYEQKDGRMRLVAAEFIVLAEGWHANHTDPPALLGQHFHLVGSPNRYGLPAFYELHVWAWRQNPKGAFVDWNPRVSCEEFTPEGLTHASGH